MISRQLHTVTADSERLSDRIVALHSELKDMVSLAPSTRVNALFKELVGLTLSGTDGIWRGVLAAPRIQALRRELQDLCARGECELESHWSKRVLAADDAQRELRLFPYYDNYVQATRIEANSLFAVKNRFIRRILFVGSGPLPLTSICLAQDHDIQVDNVDIDAEAFRRGRELSQRLGLAGRMSFFHSDILEFKAPAEYDAVFLASLVGMEETSKLRVIARIDSMVREGGLLVIRSAHRLRTLVYPELDIDRLGGFIPLIEIHPHNEVMNSNLIVQKLAGRKAS